MSDPVMRSQACPESLMPASAKSFQKLAESNHWRVTARVAIGPPDDMDLAVMSVLVRCYRGRTEVYARWECPSDRSRPFGFNAAFRIPGIHGIPDKLNFTEAKAALL